MVIGIIKALVMIATVKERARGKEIEPPFGKTWSDCYEHYRDIKQHYLVYHIKGEKSSSGISIEY